MEDKEEAKLKLKGEENWTVWKFQVSLLLKSKWLYDILTNNAKGTDKDAKTMALLVSRMSEQVISQVLSCDSAFEIWNKLLSIYEQESQVSVHLLYQQFYALNYQTNLTDLLTNVENIRSKIIARGEKLPDKMLITKVLMSLPPTYKHFISAWESLPEERQTFLELSARLHIEEIRVKEVENTEALVAKQRQSTNNNKSRLQCRFCKKFGHKISSCWFRQKKSQCTNSDTNAFMLASEDEVMAATATSSSEWVLDTGSSDHMCCERSLYSKFCESSQRKVKIGDGTALNVLGVGTIQCEAWNDCLHLQLYRDPKDRYKKGQTKASLSLQHFLGFESGFTLDKESNTIAIICQDVTVVLAFETRERLIAWQVKVGGQLGSSKEYLVMIGGGGSKKLPAGPARLHLQGRRFALTSGVPPRLLGLWELAHLRRYGVVEGRFCFEGGSHCGKGEGLHMLITDQAQDIADAFDQAAQGKLQQRTGSQRTGADHGTKSRPNTRLSDFNTADQSLQDSASALYEENYFGEDCGEVSPFWPSAERRVYDDGEYRPETEMSVKPPWSGADHITLERCNNCLTKLGGITRSSTVALNAAGHFNPEWTMEAVPESCSDNSSNSAEYLAQNSRRNQDKCKCNCSLKDEPPQRPPKPAQYDKKKPPAPLPSQGCSCNSNDNFPSTNPKVGPYENYDIPKVARSEMVNNAEYYDTPKRIKTALADDLFQVTKASSPGSLVLKKKCGCILKFGSKKKPVIVESDENFQPVDCPCQKVTNWANTLISLPYCKRTASNERLNTELFNTTKPDDTAIYATVDVSRKTNRQSTVSEQDKSQEGSNATICSNYQNIEVKDDKDFEGPYANYENLEFALSLEYYENAKDLLKKAGVTQSELDALSANIDLATVTLPPKPKTCTKCNHYKTSTGSETQCKADEYLLMEPPNDARRNIVSRTVGPNPGYTPMSPNPNWSQSLKHPISKVNKAEIEKSLSIPTLNGSGSHTYDVSSKNKEAMQKRSSSVDSARLLEDLKEFDSSIGSHATTSSMETLRNLALENRLSSPCDNDRECYECCKSSGSETKTTEESSSKDMPHLRNKHMDNAAIKRSSSVPCKGGNRDSSSSNDSGVSSCSLKHGCGEFHEFEMPLTSGNSRYQYMLHKRMRGNLAGSIHCSLPRKSKSSDLLRDQPMQLHKSHVPAKSSSAEAEVPVLPPKQFKGVLDTHSTSSGTSDMSDYIETLSLTSSHSSSETQSALRINRQPTNTLRPRSGKEYFNLDPIITSMYKNGKNVGNYTNLP